MYIYVYVYIFIYTILSYAHAFVGGEGGGPRKVESGTFEQVNGIHISIVYV